jgi:hypothetical protein
MPLEWIRDSEEEAAYQKSLANPTEKVPYGFNTYYLNGVKCGFNPPDPCVQKGKWSNDHAAIMKLVESSQRANRFEALPQLSFYFMHPNMDILFGERPYIPLPFNFSNDKNLRFDFYTVGFVAQMRALVEHRWEEDEKVIAKMKHTITANERRRKKEEK